MVEMIENASLFDVTKIKIEKEKKLKEDYCTIIEIFQGNTKKRIALFSDKEIEICR